MKWIWSTGLVIVTVSAAVSAQSGKGMNEPRMGDTMTMTYTGCVEAVNHGGSFLLTHIADDQQAMHHDATMQSDSAMARKGEPQTSSEMQGDHMMSSAVVLTGRPDLKKHVGHKVRVTGSVAPAMSETMSNNRDTLTVASLKVIAKSCS